MAAINNLRDGLVAPQTGTRQPRDVERRDSACGSRRSASSAPATRPRQPGWPRSTPRCRTPATASTAPRPSPPRWPWPSSRASWEAVDRGRAGCRARRLVVGADHRLGRSTSAARHQPAAARSTSCTRDLDLLLPLGRRSPGSHRAGLRRVRGRARRLRRLRARRRQHRPRRRHHRRHGRVHGRCPARRAGGARALARPDQPSCAASASQATAGIRPRRAGPGASRRLAANSSERDAARQ